MSTNDTAVSRRQAWLKVYLARTTVWLSTLALVYLITYSIQSVWHDPGQTWYRWMDIFSKFLWLLFAIDLVFRFFMTSPRKHFFRNNWFDTITVVIPQLRALRALRARPGSALQLQLAVLVDRGGRELPVQADFAAARVALPASQSLSLARDAQGRFNFSLEA